MWAAIEEVRDWNSDLNIGGALMSYGRRLKNPENEVKTVYERPTIKSQVDN